ncbi:MAG: 2-succinyl-5-enolpyruvyl-6-hydroxy-3-cyclohexene-1-carboxylic-acid synthase [Flavobacteriaceae bacterium]|nr:MAG: 2-succinyl-5-enolpyruvyl-6-hydroxy-3-cyclohexene-1-carboxylic-acid synthase [Flavobacteriaceae bacterium]
MYPKKQLAQLVLSACHHFKATIAVISPGSRNAPLTIGFFNHSGIETYSIVDERCAAFFALGIAQQKQQPVIVLCTSGSALLNYYPAIAEAFYSHIPLVIISADRPKHLTDIGDGQTIRQENVFKNHILYAANLADDNESMTFNIWELQNAFQNMYTKRGPIHINIPFDEPLYETVPELPENQFSKVILKEKKEVEIDYAELVNIWNLASKKLILVGVHYPNKEVEKMLNKIVEDSSVLIFTETTSNVHNSRFINDIDNLIFSLTDEQFTNLSPDILLSFGGFVVSKKVKRFLRNYQPKHHWHVSELKAPDTYFCLSEHIQTAPVTFFEQFLKITQSLESDYQKDWLHFRNHIDKKHKEYLQTAPYSDLKVFERVLAVIPDNTQVHFSNSAVIRYSQLFKMNSTLNVFCNRGTSGIDGSTSTAVGAAVAYSGNTTLITGDLSFFYDSNALWNAYIPNDFRIILINNSGGGIFRIIPGPSATNSLHFFETPHCLTAAHLCKMFNFNYGFASDIASVDIQLRKFYQKSDRPKLLEIATPDKDNDKILKEYINYIIPK